jgi:tetratricopeptide (TPR) repeat protein
MTGQGGPDGDLAAARRAALRDPRSADAQAALGRARAARGQLRQAVEAFAAAVRLRPDDVRLWVALGAARYEAGDPAGAQAAMRRVLAAAPGHDAATAHLAACLRADGDGEGAEALLRAALDADPASVAVRLELADGLLQDERHAEALALLDGPPPADPLPAAVWRAHLALARLRAGDDAGALLDAEPPPGARLVTQWRRVLLANSGGDADLARDLAREAGSLLDAPGEPHEQRVTACFNLGRFWAARGEPATAFALWTEGHRLMQSHQPFRREAFARFVDASVERFDRARLHDGPRAKNADPAPVFVVGMPRSGTTLCEQVLAAHRDVFGAGERTELAAAFQRLGGARESAEAVARVSALGADALDAAAESYLAALHALGPEARVVDKMPGNFRLLGFASLLFPAARAIHCVRDPRDVGFSIFSRRFMGHHPYAHDLRDLGFYIGQHHRLTAHWAAAAPIPILRVHLHDWIRDFKGTLTRILDFIELPYDPACERFHESEREVRTASRDQVRRPVNRLGLGRWRDYASELAPLIEELQAAGLLAPPRPAYKRPS